MDSLKNKLSIRHIFVFSTRNLSPTQRVKFHYALKGRTNPGILSKTNSKYLAKTIIETSEKSSDTIAQFLDNWNCTYNILKLSKGKSHLLVKYSTTQLNSTQLVQFTHGLYGRSKPGIIKRNSKEKLAKGYFFLEKDKSKEIIEFLNHWNCQLLIEEVDLHE